VIPAPLEQVYEAFIDAKKHSAFTGSRATCNPKIGGEFTAWNGYVSGKNPELERGEKIVQEWITADRPQEYSPSRLELTSKKIKDGTETSMMHSKVPEKQTDDLTEGWNEFYWKPVKGYFKK
jgi:activator of HSP90 ATPase